MFENGKNCKIIDIRKSYFDETDPLLSKDNQNNEILKKTQKLDNLPAQISSI